MNIRDNIIDTLYVILVIAAIIFCVIYSANHSVTKNNSTVSGETKIETSEYSCDCKCCGK